MKTDLVHLIDMRQAIERIQAYIAEMDEADFLADPKTIAACEHELSALGEASKNVSHPTQSQLRGVRWTHLRLVRNTLSHEHYQINPRTLWRTLRRDLPPLKSILEKATADPLPFD